MHVGTRKIRSAGRSSGSIEITLPSQLHALEGLRCHIRVHDGQQPQIVLQPDLKELRPFLRQLWHNIGVGLEPLGDLGEFVETDFHLALFPPAHWLDRPPLAYVDVLLVQRKSPSGEAFGSLLCGLTMAASQRFGLQGGQAATFGDAVAYVMTGNSTGLGGNFERGMAYQVWQKRVGGKRPLLPTLKTTAPWKAAQAGMTHLLQQFLQWQEQPGSFEKQREAWLRALTLEINSA